MIYLSEIYRRMRLKEMDGKKAEERRCKDPEIEAWAGKVRRGGLDP